MTEQITIGVAGAGTMGTGIAIVAARAGFPTILFDLDAARVDSAIGQMRAFLAKSVQRGKLTEAQLAEIIGRVSGTSDIAAMSPAGLQ